MLEDQNRHRIDVTHTSPGENEGSDTRLLQGFALVLLSLDILILRNQKPTQFAEFLEYRSVIRAARQNIGEVSDRLPEFFERPYDGRADILIEKDVNGQ